MKILIADVSAKVNREDISIQQFGMRVYTKLVTIME
jgi:hypothetical protein